MNRLDTTERSSANPSRTTCPASWASAASAAAVTAVVGVSLGARRMASSTSVVVPVREM
jgi:hypothetical protein